MTLSASLIEYCSPTLAGIKAAGLFGLTPDDPARFAEEVRELQLELDQKGLRLVAVPSAIQGRFLCYLYRTSHLSQILSKSENLSFLSERGYPVSHPDALLPTLYERLSLSSEFPHEIGLFLGYPLEDVKAFIENRGQNCICCGCWKVYSNEADAVRQFERCKKCTALYRNLYQSGHSISDLTVAA